MTNRERTMNILHYKDADRLPAVHFGYWPDLVLEWAQQGKISMELAQHYLVDKNDAERELEKIIGWDFGWAHLATYNSTLLPVFETKILETLPDGTQRIQNSAGSIEKIRPGITSIPSVDDYLLKDRKAFEEFYLPKMQFTPDRIDLEYFNSFNENVYEKSDRPVGLWLGSVLGAIRDMTTVVGMSYLMYDEDETLLADIIDAYADMQYKCIETVLKTGAKFDYGHLWEDVCFKNGPLLSPDIFNELCAKHYKRRVDLCHQYGIDIISLDCDGVVEKLIPTWLENGVNTMFPLEVGVWGDQFAPGRSQYGKELRGVGGMDKRVFTQDKAAVDAELKRLAELASLGGFIPCPDHLLMPGCKFELVQYYAEEVKNIGI